MQIRRFFAKDMRSALSDVSRELGPDAAILSSRQIGDGVELLAAIDYDPSVLMTPAPRKPEPDVAGAGFDSEKPEARGGRASATRSKKASFDELAEDLISRVATITPRDRNDMGGDRATSFSNVAGSKQPISAAVRMPAAPKRGSTVPANAQNDAVQLASANQSVNKRSFNNQASRQPASASMAPTTGVNADERQSLQRDWQPEHAPVGGLSDLKEEVRQLRGLMQEQLQGLAWRELKQRQPLRAMLTKRLSLLELAPRLRDHYAAMEGRDVEHALATALASIARDVVVGEDAMLDNGGIYAFVGATGVGKTTTIAKLAARFALQHGAGSVALISTDSYRIAAHDQLATYARLIGCAIRSVDNASSLQDALDSFGNRRLILIDTAGMSQRDARLADQLAALASNRYPIKQLLVLSATAQRAILQESVKQFGQHRVHGAILTKLDETTSLGAVLSVLLESRLPLMASCDGQRVPEDLRSLRGAQLVDRALKLAEQYRENPDEWLLAQELPTPQNSGMKTGALKNQGHKTANLKAMATAHVGI